MTKRIHETPPPGMVNCYTEDVVPDCRWVPLDQFQQTVATMRQTILQLDMALADERTQHSLTRQELSVARGGEIEVVGDDNVIPITGRGVPSGEEPKDD